MVLVQLEGNQIDLVGMYLLEKYISIRQWKKKFNRQRLFKLEIILIIITGIYRQSFLDDHLEISDSINNPTCDYNYDDFEFDDDECNKILAFYIDCIQYITINSLFTFYTMCSFSY